MRQDVQVSLLERARAAVASKAPEGKEHCSEIPVDTYFCPERFTREREILFRRFPLIVGFSSQVARPGDWFTHDLTGVPVLVTRDLEGGLHAFLNVCRHRGARLLEDATGKDAQAFSCPFHGWTYGLDGKLLNIVCPEAFTDIDRSTRGLVPLPVAEKFGIVFVVPTPGPSFDIDRWLGPLIADFAGFGLEEFVFTNPKTYRRRMNWKLHMDATTEIYHLDALHTSTAGSGYFSNLGILDWASPHGRVVMPSPSVLELDTAQTESWRLLDHCGAVYAIFPNATMFFHEGYVELLTTHPGADADHAVLYGGMLAPRGASGFSEVVRRKAHNDTYWATMDEDMRICESIQSTLRSGANSHLTIGRCEYLVHSYHQAVNDALSGTLTL